MGKGNRSRTNRAAEIIASQEHFQGKKSGNKTKKITVITSIIVAVVLIGMIALIVINSSGITVRAKTAVKSDNYRVSGSVLTYYFYLQYSEFLSYYGSYSSYFGLDTSKSLKSQSYDENRTWYDYFMDNTVEQLTQIVSLCEAAKRDGVKLDDEDRKDIDANIDTLKEYASQNNMSLSTFITAKFSDAVKLSDIKEATEMSVLASKYLKTLNEKFKSEVTDEAIDKYVEDNKSDFITADTLKYEFKAEKSIAGAEATEEENKAYDDAKANMKKLAEELKAAATGADAFKTWMIDYLCGDTASKAFDDAVAEKTKDLADTDKPSAEVLEKAKTDTVAYLRDSMEEKEGAEAPKFGETAYASALDNAVTSVYSSVVTNGFRKIENKGVAYSDPAAEDATALNKWLFDAERKAGDSYIDETEGDTSSTYVVYLVTETAKKDEGKTVDVAHILISSKTAGYDESDTEKSNSASEAAKKKAEELLAGFNAGEKTLDAFKELGEKNTEDSNVVYEAVKEGDMVEEFNDWIFDEARAEGDTGIVKTTYGYHIMYFIGKGDPVWKVNAKNGVINDNLKSWYEETEAEFHVVCDRDSLTYVPA